MKKMLEYTVVVHQQFSFFFDLNSIKLAPCYIMKCMNLKSATIIQYTIKGRFMSR